MSDSDAIPSNHFIRRKVRNDIAAKRVPDGVRTRFPPEPNGYLHIGHAKSICLNFGIASEFDGECNLRYDDTNPEKENTEYVEAIAEDVSWLGFQWAKTCYASDYFEQLYQFALRLVGKGLAYVDDQDSKTIRDTRGTLTEPGQTSPWRARAPDENRALFERMRAGEFGDGEKVLRAKIDMASPNLNMRDPVLYRIRRAHHHRTGNAWCIYPLYDFTHGLSDAIEGVTHSLCTLEFADHRPLYDWLIEHADAPSTPEQTEFARLQLEHTVVSKRKLAALVDQGKVSGWDDPRMPTLRGLRRRGYPPEAIRAFCERIGITRKDAWIDFEQFEVCAREYLNAHAQRRMAVLDPLRVVITNMPADARRSIELPNHPQHADFGERTVSISDTLYIERDDFSEDPPTKWRRLKPGGEVRLRGAWVIRCDSVIRDSEGALVELKCSLDPDTLGKNPAGRKVKGVLHWVDAATAVEAEVRAYDRLFNVPNPGAEDDMMSVLNPASLTVFESAKLEASLGAAPVESVFQFERLGYFCADRDSTDAKRVFNRTVALRDTWAS